MQVGLGTGGVYLEDALDVFTDALSLGYRLFDLAREYGNEHVIPQALQRAQELQAAQCEQPREERDFPDACDSQAVGAACSAQRVVPAVQGVAHRARLRAHLRCNRHLSAPAPVELCGPVHAALASVSGLNSPSFPAFFVITYQIFYHHFCEGAMRQLTGCTATLPWTPLPLGGRAGGRWSGPTRRAAC